MLSHYPHLLLHTEIIYSTRLLLPCPDTLFFSLILTSSGDPVCPSWIQEVNQLSKDDDSTSFKSEDSVGSSN